MAADPLPKPVPSSHRNFQRWKIMVRDVFLVPSPSSCLSMPPSPPVTALGKQNFMKTAVLILGVLQVKALPWISSYPLAPYLSQHPPIMPSTHPDSLTAELHLGRSFDASGNLGKKTVPSPSTFPGGMCAAPSHTGRN